MVKKIKRDLSLRKIDTCDNELCAVGSMNSGCPYFSMNGAVDGGMWGCTFYMNSLSFDKSKQKYKRHKKCLNNEQGYVERKYTINYTIPEQVRTETVIASSKEDAINNFNKNYKYNIDSIIEGDIVDYVKE